MIPCYSLEITTPKKTLLRGIWLGPKKPKRVVVWVHGLGSSMFSKLDIAEQLIDKNTAVLVFNNRGHDKVAHISHASRNFKKAIRGGAAHERFTDCVDDIQGAINFARKQKPKEIFLAGHSTGSQKSVYWGAKRGRGVKGIILLAPISDYSTSSMFYKKGQVRDAMRRARRLVKAGKRSALLPEGFDAQRFLSLYSGTGPEEVFTYWDPAKNPRTLRRVRVPTLVLLAGSDEFADRPAKEIAQWFTDQIYTGEAVIIPRVGHSFRGGEAKVVSEIRRFIGDVGRGK